MPERIPQSVAITIPLYAVLSSDHITPATGKTIAITISKNIAAFGNPSGGATNATEIGSGWYYFSASTTDTGTLGPLIILGTQASIDNSTIAYNVVNANTGGHAALPDTAVTTNGSLITSGTGTAQLSVSGGVAQADLAKILTVAVSTSTAQLGVNVVNIKGTASAGAAGYIGIDWGNITAPTTVVNLSGTNIAGVNSLASGTDSVNTTATSGSTLTTGTTISGSYLSTVALDGVYWQIADSAGTLDMYFEFNVGTLGVPTSAFWNGGLTTALNTLKVYAYNWAGSSWDQIGTVVGVTSLIISAMEFNFTTAHVGTGGNLGLVRLRFQNTGLTSANFYTDRVLCAYTNIYSFPTNFSSLSIDGSGRIDLGKILGTASAGSAGYVGLDWGHITAPTTTVGLSGTTIATSQVVASVSGAVGSVTGAVGSVAGAVGSVTGNVGGNVVGSVASVTARVTANTDQLAGQTVTAAAGVTFPTSVASPTNITAGTITTVTNLTNAATSGDLTATMKTSVTTAATAATPTAAAVTGNVGGNVTGSVASVTARVTANTDQWAGGTIPAPNVTGVPLVDIKYTLGTLSAGAAGYMGVDWSKITNPTATVALTNTTISPSSSPTAAQIATAVWQDSTSGDFTVSGSIGKSLFTAGVVPGGSGGLFIAGSNAATAVNLTGNITGNLSGSVGSVTGLTTSTISTAVWSQALPGSFTSGEAGYILGNISGSIPTPTAIATAVWQDATGSDFTTAGSIGLSLYTGVSPGSQNGMFIAGNNYPTNVTFTGTLKSVQTVIDPVHVVQNQPMPGAANWSVPR